MREEIYAEAVVRQIAAFSEFLDLIALSNGQEINYESFASDCPTFRKTDDGIEIYPWRLFLEQLWNGEII